jgi:hypothetical protein
MLTFHCSRPQSEPADKVGKRGESHSIERKRVSTLLEREAPGIVGENV